MKDTLMEKIKRSLQNNIFIVFIWLFIIILSSVVTLAQGGREMLNFYKSFFQKEITASEDNTKEVFYEKLRRLYPNTHISYFIDSMGKPIIINKIKELEQKEYIWVNQDFYLQAITNLDDTVISVAITSRTQGFQPTFQRPDTYNNEVKLVTLNKTKFSDFELYIEEGSFNPSCFYSLGARRFYYFEGYYEANPGNYQSFYIGINDAGYRHGDLNLPSYSDVVDDKGYAYCAKIPSTLRNNIVNTFIITAPFESSLGFNEEPKLKFGVDYDEVRVIGK